MSNGQFFLICSTLSIFGFDLAEDLSAKKGLWAISSVAFFVLAIASEVLQ